MEREYIKIPKSSPISDYAPISGLKKLNDKYWKNEIFHHLLSFYKNYDRKKLKRKIEEEIKSSNPRPENCIAFYIRRYLEKDRFFNMNFDVFGENRNDDSEKEGFYDITISNTYWIQEESNQKIRFHFECKNLDKSQKLANKYVYYNKGHSKFDGGVYRYFNGKYAQNLSFGGMIGFVLEGDIPIIKQKIFSKLQEPFDISPEGNLIDMLDCSIENNDFTFDSKHKRKDKEFLIHHLLLDFS